MYRIGDASTGARTTFAPEPLTLVFGEHSHAFGREIEKVRSNAEGTMLMNDRAISTEMTKLRWGIATCNFV